MSQAANFHPQPGRGAGKGLLGNAPVGFPGTGGGPGMGPMYGSQAGGTGRNGRMNQNINQKGPRGGGLNHGGRNMLANSMARQHHNQMRPMQQQQQQQQQQRLQNPMQQQQQHQQQNSMHQQQNVGYGGFNQVNTMSQTSGNNMSLARDTQLALVNSLLKGGLMGSGNPNTNASLGANANMGLNLGPNANIGSNVGPNESNMRNNVGNNHLGNSMVNSLGNNMGNNHGNSMGNSLGNSLGNSMGSNMVGNSNSVLASAMNNMPMNAINQAQMGLNQQVPINNMPNFNNNNNNSNNRGAPGITKQPLLSLPNSSAQGQGLLGKAPFGGRDNSQPRRNSGGLLASPGNQSGPSSSYGSRTPNWSSTPSSFSDRGRSLNRNNNNPNRTHHNRQRHASWDSHDSRSGSMHRDRRDSKTSHYSKDERHKPSQGLLSLPTARVEDGQQEYDPAQPTEEPDLFKDDKGSHHNESQHSGILGNRKRTRSPSPQQNSDLRVTVNKKGRSVSQDGPQVKRSYTNAESGGRRRVGSESSDAGSRHGDGRGEGPCGTPSAQHRFMCHACTLDCRNLQGFEQHMRSPRHQQRMQEIMNLHMAKTDQQLQRMRAEEHLRKIDGRDKYVEIEDYCRICDKRFPGSFISHRKSQEHRKKEQLRKQEQERDEDSVRDEDDFPENLDDMVTVDATGIYDEEEEEEMVLEDDYQNRSRSQTSKGSTERSISQKSPADKGISVQEKSPTSNDNKEKLENQNSPKQSVLPSTKAPTPTPTASPEGAEYDPETATGQEYVIPVTGFFCKLCHKFYQNETAARVTHCQSQPHFSKYKNTLESKSEKKAGSRENVKELNVKHKQEESGAPQNKSQQNGEKEDAEPELVVNGLPSGGKIDIKATRGHVKKVAVMNNNEEESEDMEEEIMHCSGEFTTLGNGDDEVMTKNHADQATQINGPNGNVSEEGQAAQINGPNGNVSEEGQATQVDNGAVEPGNREGEEEEEEDAGTKPVVKSPAKAKATRGVGKRQKSRRGRAK